MLGFTLSLLLGEVAEKGGVLEALLVEAFFLRSELFGRDAGVFQGLDHFDLRLAFHGVAHGTTLDEMGPKGESFRLQIINLGSSFLSGWTKVAKDEVKGNVSNHSWDSHKDARYLSLMEHCKDFST
ncbi:hypothetical protein Fmac_006013 [Flemingia macrophylla]|uniref:Uncharacterized protein n=1 Tax=Flemingia macrophylla TaxID=520843 RepID=A0ABD1N9E7_9FABA